MKLLPSRGGRKSGAKAAQGPWRLDSAHVVGAVGSVCALNSVPFDTELQCRQLPPPCTTDTLIHAVRARGLRIMLKLREAAALGDVTTPCLALLASDSANEVGPIRRAGVPETPAPQASARLGLIAAISPERVQFFEAGTNAPTESPADQFAQRYLGVVFLVAKEPLALLDPDGVGRATGFGFRWFVPDLLKHRKVWRDVLLASLVIQLLALGTPLFTQTIIDKVVVHRTESTLVVIAIGMAVFMIVAADLKVA